MNTLSSALPFALAPVAKPYSIDLIEEAKHSLCIIFKSALIQYAPESKNSLDKLEAEFWRSCKVATRGSSNGQCDLTIGLFALPKLLKTKKTLEEVANALATLMNEYAIEYDESILASHTPDLLEPTDLISSIDYAKRWVNQSQFVAAGPTINVILPPQLLGQIIPLVLNGIFLRQAPPHDNQGVARERIMVEFSQPNCGKEFHVGHTRGTTQGDFMVHLFEQAGHPVVAVNYFGDEGTHIAKILWHLQLEAGHKAGTPELARILSSIPKEERNKWLAGHYSKAVDALDLSTMTTLPCPGVVVAHVTAVSFLGVGGSATVTVISLNIGTGMPVCVVTSGSGSGSGSGSENIATGDIVAYIPLGKLWKRNIIEPLVTHNQLSEGIILTESELKALIEDNGGKRHITHWRTGTPLTRAPAEDVNEVKGIKGINQVHVEKKPKEKEMQETKETKKAAKKLPDVMAKSAKLLGWPRSSEPGISLIQVGAIGSDVDIEKELVKRNNEVKQMLMAMEAREPAICALWEETKQWSLDDFDRIYKWLGTPFDHNFFESEMSESSMALVKRLHEEGKLETTHGGAIGLDLEKLGHKGLGFCLLLKSNGSGLYITKDLPLAIKKFEEYAIDRSIYVVGDEQNLHFKQLCKVLEHIGYQQAKNLLHLSYGMVTLPSGKMSSRSGNVILFDDLKNELATHLRAIYTSRHGSGGSGSGISAVTHENKDVMVTETGKFDKTAPWSTDEIENAVYLLSLATFKFGFLKHNPTSPIVFNLKEWSEMTGSTGPYIMYAYTRTLSILRRVPEPLDVEVDWSTLASAEERAIFMNIHRFWPMVVHAGLLIDDNGVCKYSANPLCVYLHDMCKRFSAWYEKIDSIKDEKNKVVQKSRLHFVRAISMVIFKGLALLGIRTLDRM